MKRTYTFYSRAKILFWSAEKKIFRKHLEDLAGTLEMTNEVGNIGKRHYGTFRIGVEISSCFSMLPRISTCFRVSGCFSICQ